MEAVKGALILAAVLVLAIIAAHYYDESNSAEPYQEYALPASVSLGYTEEDSGRAIKYRGKKDQSVLLLLEKSAQIKTVANSPEQVVSINGRGNDENHEWVYTVDGMLQSAPPAHFITTPGQEIIWHYKETAPID